MNHFRRGIAVTDLLAVAAILLLVTAIGVPTLERARELSKRAVCAVNLKALGGAGNVYADANKGQWMAPGFRHPYPEVGIQYICTGNQGCVGYQRGQQTTASTPEFPTAGSTSVTTTRAFWMLVRSGDVTVKQFVCPSNASDLPDPTIQPDSYYDFARYRNISYGYLVPFGPPNIRPRSTIDGDVVVAADKSPNYQGSLVFDFMTRGPNGTPLEDFHAPVYWRFANSPNHGGQWTGEGQNTLHGDGRVEFHRKPIVGSDGDNIYTVMRDEWGEKNYGRIHGDYAYFSQYGLPYPGEKALGSCNGCDSTTDSLIYP